RTQLGTLWQAVVELRALVPETGDLVEDRDRVGDDCAAVAGGVMPQDRDRPDRGIGERIAGASESGARVRRGRLPRLGCGHSCSIRWVAAAGAPPRHRTRGAVAASPILDLDAD